MYSRDQKAFFKITNLFKNVPCDISNFMYIFEHTVKPVLLYSSEILGIFSIKSAKKHPVGNNFLNSYNLLPAKKLNLCVDIYWVPKEKPVN
jgi:hypothetical protein